MAEGYKVGEVYKNQYSFNTYEIKDIEEKLVIVDVKEISGFNIKNHPMKKTYFEEKVDNGELVKIENVPCGTIEDIYGKESLKLDGSTIQLKEMVNHPKHYNTGKYEVIDVIEDWNLNFALGNAVKYIARCNYKENKLQDLKKALWYLQHEIDKIEKGGVQ